MDELLITLYWIVCDRTRRHQTLNAVSTVAKIVEINVTWIPEIWLPALADPVGVAVLDVAENVEELVEVAVDECVMVADTDALEAAAQTTLDPNGPAELCALQSSSSSAAQLSYVAPGHAAVHS